MGLDIQWNNKILYERHKSQTKWSGRQPGRITHGDNCDLHVGAKSYVRMDYKMGGEHYLE